MKIKYRGVGVCSSLALSGALLATNMANAFELEEIVVTAQKKSQSLVEVPISMAVVGETELVELGLSDPMDLALKIPGLDVDQGGGGTIPRWNLRGMSFDGFQPGNGAPVAVYYDEVFSPDILGGMPLFDMENVEVLRGPQGTLWGGSTTGGLVHFISKKPVHGETNGYGSATFGNEGQRQFEGAVNVPLIDDVLSSRFSVLYSERDSYYENIFPGVTIPDNEQMAARAQFLWDPTDTLSVNLKMHYRDFDGAPVIYSSIGQGPNGENSLGYVDAPGVFTVNKNAKEELYNTVQGANLKVSWLVGDLEVVSLTAYDDGDDKVFFDGDSSPDWVDQDLLATEREQFSQELRISNTGAEGLQWTLGAFFYDSTVNSNIAFAANPSLAFFSAQTLFEQEDTYTALFGQASYAITEQLDLTIGLRYTEEEKSIESYQVFYTSNPVNEFDANLSPDGVFVNLDAQESETWSEPTWDVSLNYLIDEKNSLYAKIARGFRGGNFDSAGFSGSLDSVDPEILTAYEFGGHFTFLENRLRANGAVYYYDLEGQQVTGRSEGAAFTAKLFNAADSEVFGFEGDIMMQVTEAFSVNGGFAYTKAEYGDGVIAQNALRAEVDIGGNQFTRAPEWTGFIGLAYEVPTEVGTFKIRTDWRFVGETYWGFAESDEPDAWIRDSYSTGNIRLAYLTPDENIEVSVWGKNITESHEESSVSPRIFNGAALTAPTTPRLYGITARMNF